MLTRSSRTCASRTKTRKSHIQKPRFVVFLHFGALKAKYQGTMKIKYKRRNCPRLQNTIKQAIHIVHEHCGGWWRIGYYLQRPDAFGELIFNIAYKADKYDVLNKLADGCRRLAKAFIRADIRWERPTRLHTIGTLIIIFIFILTF